MRIFGFVRALYGRQAVLGGAGVLLLSVLLSAAQFLSAWQLGRMLDAVSAGLSDVLAEAALLTAAVAAQFAADVLLFRLMQGMTLRLSNLLHGKLTEKLCRAAYKPLSLRDDGELMTTITESAEGLGACFSVLASLAQLPVKVLVVFAAIFRIHWALFALCLVLFPLTLLPSLLLSKKLYALHLEEQRAAGAGIRFLQETMDFLIVLKSCCMEGLFARKNRARLDALEKASLRRDARDRLIQSFARCIGYAANPLLLTAAAYLILRGDMTVGMIVSVMFFIDIAGQGIQLLVGVGGQWQGVRSCMARIDALLELPDERTTGAEPAPVRGAPSLSCAGFRSRMRRKRRCAAFRWSSSRATRSPSSAGAAAAKRRCSSCSTAFTSRTRAACCFGDRRFRRCLSTRSAAGFPSFRRKRSCSRGRCSRT